MIRIVSLVVLILLFLLLAVILFYPDYESPRIIRFLIIIGVMFLLSLVIFFAGRGLDFEKDNRTLFYIIVLLALAVRLIILAGAGEHFYLSDEIYRYIWDGRVCADGLNPYEYKPMDDEVAHLRDRIIHPDVPDANMRSVHPPLAQDFCLAAYFIGGGSPITFKLMFALFEFLTFFLLLKWLRIIGIKRENLLLYLFSPLILVEFYISAHLDILGIPFLLAAFISMEREKPLASGLLMACAASIKFYGLFFVPFILFRFKGRSRLIFPGAFLLFALFLYLPYVIGTDLEVFGDLPASLMEAHFFASAYDLLLHFFDTEIVRYIVLGVFGALLMSLLFIKTNVYQKMYALFTGYVVLTPALFPWSLIWIYPFIVRNLSPAFWYLTGSILLSYGIFVGTNGPELWAGDGSGDTNLRLICYIPFYLLLLWSAGRWLKGRIKRT